MHVAAYSNLKADGVLALLEFKADLEAKDSLQCTPLHHAVSHGRHAVVTALLNSGANVHACDDKGWNSLHKAAFIGYGDGMMQILKHGVDITSRTKDGETALHFLASQYSLSKVSTNFALAMILAETDPTALAQLDANLSELQLLLKDRFTGLFGKPDNDPDIHLKFCSLHPEDHVYRDLLGQSLCISRRYNEAMSAFDLSVQLNPANFSTTSHANIRHRMFCIRCYARSIVGLRFHCMNCHRNWCEKCKITDKTCHWCGPLHQPMQIPSDDWLSKNLVLASGVGS